MIRPQTSQVFHAFYSSYFPLDLKLYLCYLYLFIFKKKERTHSSELFWVLQKISFYTYQSIFYNYDPIMAFAQIMYVCYNYRSCGFVFFLGPIAHH
jgi:hypothetical protein